MSILNKIIFSVLPILGILIITNIMFRNSFFLESWHVLLFNLALILQTYLLYNNMVQMGIEKSKIIFYIVISIIFLPFHLILIWFLLPTQK